jgi:hypothetical protein
MPPNCDSGDPFILIKIYGRSIIDEEIFISKTAFYVNIIFEANEQLKPVINAVYINTYKLIA